MEINVRTRILNCWVSNFIVNNKVIGSVGIAGAGGPEQDDAIAQKIVTLFQ